MASLQRIAPCLWFDHEAQEAVAFYTSIFANSRVTRVMRHTEAGQAIHGRAAGSVLAVAFELDGQPFTALNGGPAFRFNEAVSLQVSCGSQAEIDHYWERLCEGGDETAQRCGWLKDRYGLSWQVVPSALPGMLDDPDRARAARTMEALLTMRKLDLATLERAHAGG